MHYEALATDYDGTIAQNGVVADETLAALQALKQTGRKLVMVTGRELTDLERVCPHLDLFDRIVAENGAVVLTPGTGERRLLGPKPPTELIERLWAQELQPLSVGDVIVATWEQNEEAVRTAIRDLGLDLRIINNKGAVMVLPEGISKASGLAAALDDLGVAPDAVVAMGDAENDLDFMKACGCAVAVDNALDEVKAAADYVTEAPRGAGVAAAIETWLAREEDLVEAAAARRARSAGTGSVVET